jgi:hypothetical protein
MYVLFGALLFLYLELFILPGVPVAAAGDQSIYLLDATRMLHAEVIYRDFFEFTPPGTALVYLSLFKLFAVRAWIPDAMLILLGISLVGLSIVISKQLICGPAVYLSGLLFLSFGYQSALDGTHHWYSTLAVTAALATVLKERTPARLTTAGALCGLAECFNQAGGLAAIAGFGVFLLWERYHKLLPWRLLLKRAAHLSAPFLIITMAFNGYFAWKAGVARFLYCTILFVIKYYPADSFNTWRIYLKEIPSVHNWRGWPALGVYFSIHCLIPLIYVVFILRYIRESRGRPSEPWDRLMLVSILGMFMFFGVAPAPSYLRLCSVSLPAFILLAWLVTFPGRLERVLRYALWLAALLLLIAEPAMKQTEWQGYLDLPTGRTAFLNPSTYSKARWVSQRLKPGDFFFGDQLITFALGLQDPATIDFVRPTDYTRPAQVQNLLAALEASQVRFVIWYWGLDQPSVSGRTGDHLGPLRAYLRSRYHVARIFANLDEVWERNR